MGGIPTSIRIPFPESSQTKPSSFATIRSELLASELSLQAQPSARLACVGARDVERHTVAWHGRDDHATIYTYDTGQRWTDPIWHVDTEGNEPLSGMARDGRLALFATKWARTTELHVAKFGEMECRALAVQLSHRAAC